MTNQAFHPLRSRTPAVLATVAIHAGILVLWLQSGSVATMPGQDGPRIQWVNVKLPAPRPPRSQASKPPVETRPVAATRSTLARPSPATTIPAESAVDSGAPDAVVAHAPPARTADDVMQQAKRDLGAISKQLKKEFPGPKIRAPVNTPQSRLEKGINLAHELAPTKWYEAPKVREMNVADSPGTRRYRLVTPNGVHCMTVGPTHTATGLTMGGNANPIRVTTCPKDEEPPTVQNYEERP